MKPYSLVDDLLRPLRWLMTETAKTVHRLQGRRGHLWERRYRAKTLAKIKPWVGVRAHAGHPA